MLIVVENSPGTERALMAEELACQDCQRRALVPGGMPDHAGERLLARSCLPRPRRSCCGEFGDTPEPPKRNQAVR